MKKILLFLLFISIFTDYVSAQQKIFINPAGIEGESNDAKHNKWIEGKAYSVGASVKSPTAASVTEPFKFTICVDKSTVALRQRLHLKSLISQVEIEFVVGGGSTFVYYKLLLENVSVVELNEGGTTDDNRLLVNVSFAPQKYRSTYTLQNPDGSAGTVVTFGWNTVTNTSY